MSTEKDIIISARGLKKSFGTGDSQQVIFENLDLDIYRGDFTVIMGSSGAGKSTLMYSLSGMDRPTAGAVHFAGREITKCSDDQLAIFRRKHCGFVFQQIYLLDKMSLMDNVLTAGALCKGRRKELIRRAKELFELVNIPEITQKKFSSQVSGGEAQRAGIVRAVINRPEAVVRDFRDTDFDMNTVFYNIDDERSINRLDVSEESANISEPAIYLPLYVTNFGEFAVGDEIVYEVNGEEYTFFVAGIAEEMQYGNYGKGMMGAYLSGSAYEKFYAENKENAIVEYSLVSDDAESVESIKNEVGDILEEKGIAMLAVNDCVSTKDTRTMVCNLLILILIAFACVILLVSVFLSKFRISNSIEDEMVSMGVLKAMGYTGNMIIASLVIPYMLVTALSAGVGVMLSYIILPALADFLTMQSGFFFELAFDLGGLACAVIIPMLIVFVFTVSAAKRIRKIQPISAIRGGGEASSTGNNPLPLEKTRFSTSLRLVLKQMCAAKKQNALLFLVSFVLTVLVAFSGTLFYRVTNNLCYSGTNPQNRDEIALGSAFEGEFNIGDTVILKSGEESYTYKITGFVQSVNYQGAVCELTTDGYKALCGEITMPSLYVYLDDGVAAEEIISRYEDVYSDIIIKTIDSQKMTETTQEMYMSISAVIIAVIFILTMLIVLFILYIVIKSLLVRRKQELGIYKAMGYTSGQLMLQTTGSFLPVTIAAVLLSSALGMIYMPYINGIIFSAVGAVKNNMELSFAFLMIFAAVLIAMNFIISICLTMPIRKISAYSLIKE